MPGLGLVAVSLILGCLAQDLGSRNALLEWHREHHPDALFWRRTFEPLLFREIQDPKLLHRLLRSLPTRVDADGSVWSAENTGTLWVAIHEEKGERTEAEVRFFGPSTPLGAVPAVSALKWEPEGTGWPAVEAILRRISRRPVPAPPKTAAKPRVSVDPHEIHY